MKFEIVVLVIVISLPCSVKDKVVFSPLLSVVSI